MLLDINRNEDLQTAVEALKAGRLVAFPTETVYGLGADGFNEAACRAVYEAKGRPSDNPLILHIADMSALRDIAEDIPEAAVDLAEAFWPGPLTLVLKKKPCVPDVVSAGGDTVGLRFPANPVCRAFLRACGCPVAAPSANLSSQTSPVTASPVIDAFYGAIDAVLDGGKTAIGTPSTILSLAGERPELIRAGALPESELKALLGL